MRWLRVVLGALCVTAFAPLTASAAMLVGLQDGAMTSESWETQRWSVDTARTSGAQIVRITLAWKDVAQACGSTPAVELRSHTAACYDWQRIDRVVARARLRHLTVLASIWQTPTWVLGSDDSAYVGSTDAEFTTLTERYADFASAAASRYKRTSSIGWIQRWTILNEPNSIRFWHPNTSADMTRYASLYARAAKAIDRVESSMQIAPGPLGPKSSPHKPVSYMRGVRLALEQSAPAAPVDAWALNPYPGTTVSPYDLVYRSPSVGIGNLEDFVRALDERASTRGKPIWATEFAYQSNPPDKAFGASLLNQSLWLAQAMDRAASTQRVPIFIWYVLRDPVDLSDWNSGLFTTSGAAKPARSMFGRPLSVAPPRLDTSRGARVWGRSSFDATGAWLEFTRDRTHWRRLRVTRSWGGAFVTRVPRIPRLWIRVHDRLGAGPTVHVGA